MNHKVNSRELPGLTPGLMRFKSSDLNDLFIFIFSYFDLFEYKTTNFCVNVMAVFSLQSIIGIQCIIVLANANSIYFVDYIIFGYI